MKRIALLKVIANGGATLDASGATVSFRRGYQVSRKDCYTLNVRNTNKILRAVRSVLADLKAGEYCGLWLDDNGMLCVDVSERVERLSAAIRKGIERKQKGIFDWCMNRTIQLES